MVELYCPHRMTMKRVVLVIASLWINCDCQRFTSVSEKRDVPLGANVSLIWKFEVESGIFVTGLWSNTQGTNVMSKFGNETSEALPGFETKIVPCGQYGMTVLNVMEEDSGAYTAVFAIRVGGSTVPFQEKAYIQGHNVSVPLDFVMYIEGNSTNDTVESGATVNVTAVAPPNDPPSINVSITIYTETPYVTGDWPNSDETMPRSLDFEVPSDKLLTLLTVEACLSHPAVSNQTCKEAQFTIQNPNAHTSSLVPDDTYVSTDNPSPTEDPNTLTSSLAPDDTSVSTDTLPSTEDPTVTQPSSSPTVTASDDPQSGWSHWYILLIALGCLIILVVIAVVIHRRSQRKDDDLSPVTELKPPSVPADRVCANTAGYRPSQHQHPRREDNTAYYVQGTSGARL